jgi:hypothetical protein
MWFLITREENRLQVFENEVFRKIFGPKKDKVSEQFRTLHNEEFLDLYRTLTF